MPDETYKADPRHPNDDSCDDVTRLVGLTTPRQWRGHVVNGLFNPFDDTSTAAQDRAILNFWQFAPKGYQVRVEIINFARSINTAVGITIEFYDPQYQTAPAAAPNLAEVIRLLNPTLIGGLDVHHYVNTNSGDGWAVPVTDNGRPWNLRIISDPATTITASWHVHYNYIRIVGG